MTPALLRKVATVCRQFAYRAIEDASGQTDYAIAELFAEAAQKLRDAKTFEAHANVLEFNETQE